MALDNTAEVETPEHIRFRYRVAGPTRRGFAYLIDLGVRLVVVALAGLLLKLSFAGDHGAAKASNGVLLVVAFVLEWGYYVLFETTAGGRTPGKRALGLRVIKEGGQALGFLDSVLRNLLRAADFLPVGYALGLVVMGGDRRFRRLGDWVAGTVVVLEERSRLAAPLVLHPPATADELAALPVRPALSSWEREGLELFLRRSDLTAARRDELAALIAPVLAARLGVPLGQPTRLLALVHHRIESASGVAGHP